MRIIGTSQRHVLIVKLGNFKRVSQKGTNKRSQSSGGNNISFFSLIMLIRHFLLDQLIFIGISR